jgi:hypothetical protein
MNNWLAIFMVLISIVIIVGNISTFQKSTKHKMRKKPLNEMKETLPRSKKNNETAKTKNRH